MIYHYIPKRCDQVKLCDIYQLLFQISILVQAKRNLQEVFNEVLCGIDYRTYLAVGIFDIFTTCHWVRDVWLPLQVSYLLLYW